MCFVFVVKNNMCFVFVVKKVEKLKTGLFTVVHFKNFKNRTCMLWSIGYACCIRMDFQSVTSGRRKCDSKFETSRN